MSSPLLPSRPAARTAAGAALVGLLASTLLSPVVAASPAAAEDRPAPSRVERQIRFTTGDGISLATTLSGTGRIKPRPTVVEFSPYGAGSGSLDPGRHYNTLLVEDRGTGNSDGEFDALGPRAQRDVVEVLRWTCRQRWSKKVAVNGFSASAIMLYNSLHQEFPGCVKTMITRSGTFELYRDLLVPGGIMNLVPGGGVLALIGGPALLGGADRTLATPLGQAPRAAALVFAGLNAGLLRPTQDSWWRKRGFRGDANDLPLLAIDGWFDVESRGGFQAYQEQRSDGAHLLIAGGHDGAPAGTDGGLAKARAWLDHYLRGERNGVRRQPRVDMLLSAGDREDYVNGRFVHRRARDWPLPRTRWTSLSFNAKRSGTAASANDGSLTVDRPRSASTQSYAAAPSIPTQTDPFNTAIVGASGLDALTTALPALTDDNLAGGLGLTYTTGPLREDVDLIGPASVRLRLSSTSPETGIWVVLSDVWPDGTSHPLTAGRLLNAYPDVVRRRSLTDRRGRIVQPYGDFSAKSPAGPGEERTYHVEVWPVGNRFRAGHRIRVQVVGASAVGFPTVPGVNSLTVGGRQGARVMLPVAPGSDLAGSISGGR